MFKALLLLLVCAVSTNAQSVGLCSPDWLMGKLGTSLCPVPEDSKRLTSNPVNCKEQAGLVCACVRQQQPNADDTDSTTNLCDECNWGQGKIVGSTGTNPGMIIGTFNNFIECPKPPPSLSGGAGSPKTFGGTVGVFYGWDYVAPYCYDMMIQNYDANPFDGQIEPQEEKAYGIIVCTSDMYWVVMRGFYKGADTVYKVTDSMQDKILEFQRDAGEMNRINVLRKLHANKRRRGSSPSHTSLIATISAGVACVAVVAVIVAVVARRRSSTDYSEMREMDTEQ